MSVWDVVVAIAEAFLGDSSQWANRRSAQRADRRGPGRTLSTSFDIPVSIEFQRASWFQRPDGSWLRWEASANSWVAAPEGPPPEMAQMLGAMGPAPTAPEGMQLPLPAAPAGDEPGSPAETVESAWSQPSAASPAAPPPAPAAEPPAAPAAPDATGAAASAPADLAASAASAALTDLRTRADLVKAVILEVGLDAREASEAVETVLRVLEEQRVERARRRPAAPAEPPEGPPPT